MEGNRLGTLIVLAVAIAMSAPAEARAQITPSGVDLTSPISAWDTPWITFSASASPGPGVTVTYVKFYVDLPASQRTSANPNPSYSCGPPPAANPSCQYIGAVHNAPYVTGGFVTLPVGVHTATVQAWRHGAGDPAPVFLGQSSKTFRRAPPGPPVPTRAAFYYPWYPESWTRPGLPVPTNPYTKWAPDHCSVSCPVGYTYDLDGTTTGLISDHIEEMRYGNLSAGIVSWWGCSKGPDDDGSQCPQGATRDSDTPGVHAEASRLPKLFLNAANGNPVGSDFHWALYYEPESEDQNTAAAGVQDPSVEQIKADLKYIANSYTDRFAYWREVGSRPVIFVHNSDDATTAEGCDTISRWKQATTELSQSTPASYPSFWVVLKTFPGFNSCAANRSAMPEAWHEYGPAAAYQSGAQTPATPGVYGSVSISPGFDQADDTRPRLNCANAATCRPFLRRDLYRWRQNVRDMEASPARYKLITTFNEWREGTAVEPAHEWTSPVQAGQTRSFGQFLDILHSNGLPVRDPVIAAAGDIAEPPSSSQRADVRTSDLILNTIRPDLVLTLGDTQYNAGELLNFSTAYQNSWGRFKAYTNPSTGNHEGDDPAGRFEGYFDYHNNGGGGFGGFASPDVPTGQAGGRGTGYYRWDIGSWRLIALNTEIDMSEGSPQDTWLETVGLQNPPACILAYMHRPRFTNGNYTSPPDFTSETQAAWEDLYAAGADVVLSGHDHNYQRWRKQDPAGNAVSNGIRQFVVGTGGRGLYPITGTPVNRIFATSAFGVLKMQLKASSFNASWIDENGVTQDVIGNAPCN